MNGFESIDPALVQEVQARIRSAYETASAKLSHVTAATLDDFRPTTPTLASGIGYVQNEPIGSTLLPETMASPDGTENASYPVFGKEAFYVGDDLIALNAEAKETSGDLTWVSITLDVRGKMEWIDDRLERIAQLRGMSQRDKALNRVETQVNTGKEYRQALLLQSSGTYASASHYETLTGSGQWSHADSDPVKAISIKNEFLRGLHGKKANTLWLGEGVAATLSYNKALLALVNGGASKANPAFPMTVPVLAAMLGLNIAVGGGVYTSTIGGSTSDIWGDNAGLLYVDAAELDVPKFGATLVSSGFPQVTEGRDELRGAKGSAWVKFVTAYKAVCQLNTAGYLWLDCSA